MPSVERYNSDTVLHSFWLKSINCTALPAIPSAAVASISAEVW
jgi:hypothetical protein